MNSGYGYSFRERVLTGGLPAIKILSERLRVNVNP